VKIIRHKDTKGVYHLFPDGVVLKLTEEGLTGDYFADTKSLDFELIEGVEPPELFVGKALTYGEEGWTVVDKERLEAYKADLQREQLQAARKYTKVSMRQFRKALFRKGEATNVSNILQSLPAGKKEEAEIDFEYSAEVERLSPLVESLALALNKTEEELDELFTLAKSLR
jgi:hypothetical protein